MSASASAVTPSATIVMPILLTLYAVRPANTPTLTIGGDIDDAPKPALHVRQAGAGQVRARTLIDVIRSYPRGCP